jgi:hypothetical protein
MLPYGIRSNGEYRHFVFQTRDWKDDTYDVAMYFVREAKGGEAAKVTTGVSRYYAITIDRLMSLFEEVGFVEIRRLDEIMFQPVIVGRRALAHTT